jgi:hypothetical protein
MTESKKPAEIAAEIASAKPESKKKKKFTVKVNYDKSAGIYRRDVFIDDELFEYEIDQPSLIQAKEMGPEYEAQAKRSIEEHFINSLSDFVGRKITARELIMAIQTGWI